ncbi:MAG: ATP-binding cassette domain-containing protein [Spirochaetaceae bacterium]|nr:ATP-binding cassette domain-containing protein [Spirochaetaceae bacterium]
MDAVRMSNITRLFLPAGVRANDHVNLSVAQGCIHAIVGENGAGKSTLMRILAGLDLPDEGSIEVEGRPVSFTSAADAARCGIGMMHQHFLVFEELSVAENILFGQLPRHAFGIIDRKRLMREAADMIQAYGFALDPAMPAEELGVSGKQQLELLRLLAGKARILILDEPTSLLTEQESAALFATLTLLKGRTTILLVTHKIDDVLKIADAVTVMRQGKVVASLPVSSVQAEELACLIMGTSSCVMRDRQPHGAGASESVLSIRNLGVRGKGDKRALSGISFSLSRGEILGVCAMGGNGLAELEDVLAGFRTAETATAALQGIEGFPDGVVEGSTNFHALLHALRSRHQLSYLPSDRIKRGAAPDLPVLHNFIAPLRERYFKNGRFQKAAAEQSTFQALQSFAIKAHPHQKLAELSGGNMQKLALARLFLEENGAILLLCEPTWGLDIRATDAIHERIVEARDRGRAVLLLSTDVDEILELSDSIMVLHRGCIVFEGRNDGTLTRDRLGRYLLGIERADSA